MNRLNFSERTYNIITLVALALTGLVVVGVSLTLLRRATGPPGEGTPPVPTEAAGPVVTSVRPTLPPTWTPSPLPTVGPSRTPFLTATITGTPPTPTPGASITPVPSPTRTPTVPPAVPTAALDRIPLGLALEAEGLSEPTRLADAGDLPGRLYVLEQRGLIRIVQDGTVLGAPFLDISGKVSRHRSEDGLLGIAFHPDYASNGTFFLYYTNTADESILARYHVSGDPDRADPASETVLLRLPQPSPEHNGGDIAFGPDGYLYVGLGDGGGGTGDKFGNAQNGGTLLGSILRLDVDSGSPYGIPSGNPFVGDPAFRDEIWAYGLRNPWSLSFDRQTGQLYIVDVGESAYEEINVQPAGRGGLNYGWPLAQGNHCYPNAADLCSPPGSTPPALEVPHTTDICALIGGYVYRGSDWPVLRGTYLYADFCYGQIYALRRVGGAWQTTQVTPTAFMVSAFGQDRDGELFVLDFGGGRLYRVVAGQ